MSKTKLIDIFKKIRSKHFRQDQNALDVCLETVDNIHQYETCKVQAIERAEKISKDFAYYLKILNAGYFEIQLSERRKFELGI